MRDRLHRLYILASCLLYFLLRGPARKNIGVPDAVIIAPSGKLGDIVCATPMFRAVRERFPRARIILYGSIFSRTILSDGELFDDFIEDAPGRVQKLKRIRSNGTVFAVLNGTSFVTLAALYLAGIPKIAAPISRSFRPIQQTVPYRVIARFVHLVDFEMGQYVPGLYVKLLRPVGIDTDDTTKHLGYSRDAVAAVQKLFAENDIQKSDTVIGMTFSAGNRDKEWPSRNFAELIRMIREKYPYKIVAFGSAADRPQAEEVKRILGLQPAFIDTIGKFNIDSLKAAVSRVTLFIGVDTGPVYIAEAFGVPTIDITGAVDIREQPPRGAVHFIVTPPGDPEPLMHVLDSRSYDHDEARKQIESITAEHVFTIFEKLIIATDLK